MLVPSSNTNTGKGMESAIDHTSFERQPPTSGSSQLYGTRPALGPLPTGMPQQPYGHDRPQGMLRGGDVATVRSGYSVAPSSDLRPFDQQYIEIEKLRDPRNRPVEYQRPDWELYEQACVERAQQEVQQLARQSLAEHQAQQQAKQRFRQQVHQPVQQEVYQQAQHQVQQLIQQQAQEEAQQLFHQQAQQLVYQQAQQHAQHHPYSNEAQTLEPYFFDSSGGHSPARLYPQSQQPPKHPPSEDTRETSQKPNQL